MNAPLFVKQVFMMHSGEIGYWKIECDALSSSDLDTLAFMLFEILPPFGKVHGIPRGGITSEPTGIFSVPAGTTMTPAEQIVTMSINVADWLLNIP